MGLTNLGGGFPGPAVLDRLIPGPGGGVVGTLEGLGALSGRRCGGCHED